MNKWIDDVTSKWKDNNREPSVWYDTTANAITSGTIASVNIPIDKSFWTIVRKTRNNPIKKVIFNGPATIVFWDDGTKTIVKCSKNDSYDREKGLAMAIAKYCLGNNGKLNSVFKKFLKDE